jgi:hypothetical protein
MSINNTGSVDLESVLNIRRRALAAIGETTSPRQEPHYTSTIYLKREDSANSLLSIDSKILIFGELHLLYTTFERYTSNITVYEEAPIESNPSFSSSSSKPSFSATLEEDEEDEIEPQISSTLRQTSTSSSKESSSPPQAPSSPIRKLQLGNIGRSQTVGSTTSEYSLHNLEGKRYGCIELPNTSLIEILEIFLRSGLELVDVSSDYDGKNVLHQNFIFSKTRTIPQKLGQSPSKSTLFSGT